MAWKAIGNIAALVGVLVAMVMMFNQVDGRLDRVHERMDRMQAEQTPALMLSTSVSTKCSTVWTARRRKPTPASTRCLRR